MEIRHIAEVVPRTVPLSEIERYRKGGYEIIECRGDAIMSLSDYFIVMQRRCKETNQVTGTVILCPTFLRGGLGVSNSGGLSY